VRRTYRYRLGSASIDGRTLANAKYKVKQKLNSQVVLSDLGNKNPLRGGSSSRAGCQYGWDGRGYVYALLAYNRSHVHSEPNAGLHSHFRGVFWTDEDRSAFVNWIAANPTAGDVIQGSGGLRKVRWVAPGVGKRGGARVITYAMLGDGQVWLLVAYTKAKFDSLPTKFLVELRKEIDNAKKN